MPILSVNFGLSDFTVLYIDEKLKSLDYSLGYPYSKDLFSHFYTEEQYYTDIFQHILKKMDVKRKDLPVIATGFPNVPAIGVPYANTLTLDKLFGLAESYSIVCADSYTIFTQNEFISLQNLEGINLGENEKNYLANLHIYKNAYPTTLSTYNLLFSNIWQLANTFQSNKIDLKNVGFDVPEKPLLFFGDIFTVKNKEFSNIAYLYIFSLVKKPGVYKINFDPKNLFPLYLHASLFDTRLIDVKKQYQLTNLGTLFNSPGATSVLLETEVGTSQLLEVPANKMVFIPMPFEQKSRLVAKSALIGDFEGYVSGGSIGLIIDTRNKHDINSYSYSDLQRDININLKNIEEALTQL